MLNLSTNVPQEISLSNEYYNNYKYTVKRDVPVFIILLIRLHRRPNLFGIASKIKINLEQNTRRKVPGDLRSGFLCTPYIVLALPTS